jgi:hypothetical protein
MQFIVTGRASMAIGPACRPLQRLQGHFTRSPGSLRPVSFKAARGPHFASNENEDGDRSGCWSGPLGMPTFGSAWGFAFTGVGR